MTKAAKTLSVHLGESLKNDWLELCKARGVSAGAAIKALVEKELAGVDGREVVLSQREPLVKERKFRFEILLTESERQAIELRAEQDGCSMRRWVIDAVRAGLTKEPQFQMKEIEQLGESNYQLLAIGRNLNQVAKAMNEGKKSSVSVKAIEGLRAEIKKHVEKVDRLIRANVERWKIQA